MPTIDLADFVVVAIVGGGTAYLAGYVTGRREKAATQRERVASRRARRVEAAAADSGPCALAECPRGTESGLCLRHDLAYSLRHRVPNQPGDEDELGTDTTLDEPVEGEVVSVDIPARRRMTGLAMTPAAAMRGEARVLRQATMEVRLISDELFIGAGLREVFAAVDEEQVRLPLYEAVVSEYPTGYYDLVLPNPDQPGPTNPQKPNPGVPAPTKLIGQPRVDADVLRAIHAASRPGADEDAQPVPTTPVPTAGPRPGSTQDTDGRPAQPKPAVAGAR